MDEPDRPALRWHGGKWRLAPWIISLMPHHDIYTEAYGGAASVLLRKARAKSEIYNDLDMEVVNLFRVLQQRDAAMELLHRLSCTPFARAEFEVAYEPTEDPIERARRLVIRSFMGFSSNGHARPTGFRSKGLRAGALPQHDFNGVPGALQKVAERFRGVVIERRPALEVLARYDEPGVLHYVDPPYVPETRGRPTTDRYTYEMSEGDHAELLDLLRTLTGRVILSGYPSDLYDNTLSDWRRVERVSLADGARLRTEVVWFNFDTPDHGPLFSTEEKTT